MGRAVILLDVEARVVVAELVSAVVGDVGSNGTSVSLSRDLGELGGIVDEGWISNLCPSSEGD